VHDNTITLKAEHQDEVALWLDSSLVNLDRPITIEPVGGSRQVIKANLCCAGRNSFQPLKAHFVRVFPEKS